MVDPTGKRERISKRRRLHLILGDENKYQFASLARGSTWPDMEFRERSRGRGHFLKGGARALRLRQGTGSINL